MLSKSITVVTKLMVFFYYMKAKLETGFTFTPLPVLRHSVASFTSGTGVGSVCVGAHTAETQVILGTLIHIWKNNNKKKKI